MADGPCTVCGGTRAEHYELDGKTPRTRHAFTTNPGEMVTHEEQAKQRQGVQGNPQLQAMMMSVGSNPMSFGRLIEVLLEAKVIRVEDALYIGGFGTKPNPPSGFKDPAVKL